MTNVVPVRVASSSDDAEDRIEQHFGIAEARARRPVATFDDDLIRPLDAVQPALLDEAPVNGAKPSREGRVGGDSESDGLAVHRAPGADDQVGQLDQRRSVHRPLRNDESSAFEGSVLLRSSRENNSLNINLTVR
jgi:hypothetical protein